MRILNQRYHFTRFLNVVWIYILCLILLGAYIYQYVFHEPPCPLCELQRIAMIAVAIGPILNLRFTIRPIHYGLSLGGCIFGGAISLRQISLDICPQFTSWGFPVLGFQLYTWAFFVFVACVLGTAFLLFLYRTDDSEYKQKLFIHETIAIVLMFLIALSNTFTTFWQCGLGPCQDL